MASKNAPCCITEPDNKCFICPKPGAPVKANLNPTLQPDVCHEDRKLAQTANCGTLELDWTTAYE
jgi:hypothetical protein